MTSLDDSISKIDAQLLEVGLEIRACELAAAAAAKRDDVSERDYYRDTKNKLHDTKNKLHDEKNLYLKKRLGEEALAKEQTGIATSRHLNVLGTARRRPAHLPQNKPEAGFYIALCQRLSRDWDPISD